MTIIRPMPIRMPGTIPPRNSPPIDTLAIDPYTIIVMLGGMIAPMVPAHATSAAAKPGLYPWSFIAGTRIDPIADVSATDDPETPANTMLDTTDA